MPASETPRIGRTRQFALPFDRHSSDALDAALDEVRPFGPVASVNEMGSNGFEAPLFAHVLLDRTRAFDDFATLPELPWFGGGGPGRESHCYLLFRCVLQLVSLRSRSEDFKELEIVVLRHELSILRRPTRRPLLTTTDRVFLVAHELPITVRAGTPALTGIILTGAAGEIVLDADQL
jgi:hypothetical protein